MKITYSNSQNSVDKDFTLSDDRYYLKNPIVGDFEWWYFDFLDKKNDLLIKIVFHIGTDPLRKKVYPKISISANIKEWSEYKEFPVLMEDFSYSENPFLIKVKDQLEISGEGFKKLNFKVSVNLEKFSCDLNFTGKIAGWKPLSDFVTFSDKLKSARILWKIAQPKALVNGSLNYKNQTFIVENVIGYHDHNYWNVNLKNPLFIDEAINRWYWVKAHVGDYTIVFMDIFCRKERINSLMIAKGENLILNLSDIDEITYCEYIKEPKLRIKYASKIIIAAGDSNMKINISFKLNRLIESKNLLDGVNLAMQWIINKLVARPAYLGMLANISLTINGTEHRGLGNYELMEFRN